MSVSMKYGVVAENYFTVECFDKDGNLRWRDEFPNIVVTEGKNELLSATLAAATPVATWYVGLVDGTAPPTYDVDDIMNSHAGWVENTGYSNANRPTWTPGAVAAGSVDNSASKAVFNINAPDDVAGCFLTSNNTKGGTTGKLYGEGDFTAGSRAVQSGDTLNVTVTCTVT
jgi:hypothetical protein